jgi:hypothetical protein
MALEGGERLVLRILRDLQGDSTDYVEDARLAAATKMFVEDVRDVLEILDGKGFVQRTRLTSGFSATITAKGKLELRLTEPIPAPKAAASNAHGDLPANSPRPVGTPTPPNCPIVMTKSQRLKAISDFLTEAFSRSDLVMFMRLRGYEEIADSVNPNAGMAQFCFEVTEALEHTGRIDAQLFDNLVEARPARAAQVNTLRQRVLG